MSSSVDRFVLDCIHKVIQTPLWQKAFVKQTNRQQQQQQQKNQSK